jgi:hypothetical protein
MILTLHFFIVNYYYFLLDLSIIIVVFFFHIIKLTTLILDLIKSKIWVSNFSYFLNATIILAFSFILKKINLTREIKQPPI